MKNLKTKNIIGVFVILLFGFISSCKKEDNDTIKPTISVEEPMTGDTADLSVEPEIHFEFTATDNIGLKSVNVKLTNESGTTLFNDDPSVMDQKIFSYHDHFEPTGISVLTSLTLTITATDKSDNVDTRKIAFFAKP